MTKVIIGEDCGNSPKNIFLMKLTTAFARRAADFILGSVAEDIRWNFPGDRLIEGKDEFAKALEELTIRHVVTHGRAGAYTALGNQKTMFHMPFATSMNL